jgi:hypothetical protein
MFILYSKMFILYSKMFILYSKIFILYSTNKHTPIKNEKFLIHKSEKNQLFVFSSRFGLEALSKCQIWHADGTFYTAAKFFYQMYTIHGYYINPITCQRFMLPCAYALMTDKTECSFKELVGSIKQAGFSLCFSLNPKTLLSDFEKGAMNAFKFHFTNIRIRGCLFHFGQNLYRKWVKIGLKQEFQQDAYHKWFVHLFMLSMVPPDHIDSVFRSAMDEQPANDERCEKFLKYFVDTYFEGQFGLDNGFFIWNHYDNHGPRTNNNFEGFHNKLKIYVGAAKPNIVKAVGVLAEEELRFQKLYIQAQSGKTIIKKRRKLDIDKDNKIYILRNMLEKNEITVEVFIKNLKDIFKFNAKESN